MVESFTVRVEEHCEIGGSCGVLFNGFCVVDNYSIAGVSKVEVMNCFIEGFEWICSNIDTVKEAVKIILI